MTRTRLQTIGHVHVYV